MVLIRLSSKKYIFQIEGNVEKHNYDNDNEDNDNEDNDNRDRIVWFSSDSMVFIKKSIYFKLKETLRNTTNKSMRSTDKMRNCHLMDGMAAWLILADQINI